MKVWADWFSPSDAYGSVGPYLVMHVKVWAGTGSNFQVPVAVLGLTL